MGIVILTIINSEDVKIKKLIDLFVKKGFHDFHHTTIQKNLARIKKLCDYDFSKDEHFLRIISRRLDKLLIFDNVKNGGYLLISLPRFTHGITSKRKYLHIEIICFSKNIDNFKNVVKTILKSYSPRLKLFEGMRSDFKNLEVLNSMKETPRTKLISQISLSHLDPFLSDKTRDKLKIFRSSPELLVLPTDELIRRTRLTLDELQSFQNAGIFKVTYTPICKKCNAPLPTYDSEELVKKIIDKNKPSCTNCGTLLDSSKVNILNTHSVTEIGKPCITGLWLEALVKLHLQNKINITWMRCCVSHGNDELDIAFTLNGKLVVCECKDTEIRPNDVYIFGVKAAQLKADIVIFISPKKLLNQTKDAIKRITKEQEIYGRARQYYVITGNVETIKNQLDEIIRDVKVEYEKNQYEKLKRALFVQYREREPLYYERLIRRGVI